VESALSYSFYKRESNFICFMFVEWIAGNLVKPYLFVES